MGNKLCPKVILEGTAECRNAHFVTIKVEVYIHARSLQEVTDVVNFDLHGK